MFRKLCLWYKQILSHEGGGGWREREREGGGVTSLPALMQKAFYGVKM